MSKRPRDVTNTTPNQYPPPRCVHRHHTTAPTILTRTSPPHPLQHPSPRRVVTTTPTTTVLQAGIDDTSLELQAKLDEEYGRLVDDRKLLREVVFPRVPTTQPHYLPVNMHRILQNAILIFRIDRRKPSDLQPAYIVDAVHELGKRLIHGDDPLSQEAQANAILNFRMHLVPLLLLVMYWRNTT